MKEITEEKLRDSKASTEDIHTLLNYELREKDKEIEDLKVICEHKARMAEKDKMIADLIAKEKGCLTFEEQKKRLENSKRSILTWFSVGICTAGFIGMFVFGLMVDSISVREKNVEDKLKKVVLERSIIAEEQAKVSKDIAWMKTNPTKIVEKEVVKEVKVPVEKIVEKRIEVKVPVEVTKFVEKEVIKEVKVYPCSDGTWYSNKSCGNVPPAVAVEGPKGLGVTSLTYACKGINNGTLKPATTW